MPSFRNVPEEWARLDFRLLQNGACHLYWRSSILEEDTRWLEQNEYVVRRFDCALWTDEPAMHQALAQALGFPDYYGRNLNALNDCLPDVCGTESECLALRFEHFDSFVRRHPDVAHAVLDVIETASRRCLLWGARLLALAHSEDPHLTLPPVGASAVDWNPREFLLSSRES
ncbi:MAG: barstar family protein [Myxococcaceae bacterium]|nr:barstar family protein [Myxococcaceae bacterium]